MAIKSRLDLATQYDSILTATHEAGHTVYGLLKGFKIDEVSICEEKNKRISGSTDYQSPVIDTLQDIDLVNMLIKSEVCIFYAGLIAERYFFQKISGSDKFPLILRDGSSDDTSAAAAQIRHYNLAPPGKKRYNLKKRYIRDTLRVLEDHWEAVTSITHALYKNKKIKFEDIKNILSATDKIFWKERLNTIHELYNESACIDEKKLKSIIL
jgi:hypothetical protein